MPFFKKNIIWTNTFKSMKYHCVCVCVYTSVCVCVVGDGGGGTS